MKLRRRVGALLLGALGGLLAAGCADDGTGPGRGPLLLEAAGPALQFAAPSAPTPEPLRVAVRNAADLNPVAGAEVSWRLVEGDGATLGAASTTDSAGVAEMAVVLGTRLGRYRVEARMGEARAVFELWAVDAPALETVAPASARPGDTVRIQGRNFSPVSAHDVALFGPVRGRVVSATPTELRVEVPPCLSPGTVPVTVRLGARSSAPVSLAVTEPAPLTPIPVGGALDLVGHGDGAAACRRLPAGEYLVVVAATGAVGGARYPVGVRAPGAAAPAAARVAAAAERSPRPDAQGAWDGALRERERALIADRDRAGPAAPPRAAALGGAPQVGDRREFEVLDRQGGFGHVSAVVRHVGATAVFFEDEETPPGGLTPADYAAFAALFDDPIHPTVTSVFGRPSDLDGNGRVVVLFTPAVNRLTERGSSDGFVGGFFYGLDLLVDRAHSNQGEVFYALVPDPSGAFGDARTRELVLSSVPTILAHEFQHMVHFAERVLDLDAEGSEALWLSEGLAQMAEDRVGEALAERGRVDEALLFQLGNRKRARLFLESGPATSLLTATGAATLAERGAGWLFVRYLVEQYGAALLGSLTRTTRTGIDNVETVAGRTWPALLGEWGVALHDGGEPGVSDPLSADPRHRYPELRLREVLAAPGQSFPLRPVYLGGGDAAWSGELVTGAVAHFVLRSPADAPATLAVGGGSDGPSPASAGIALHAVRLR